jgi:hypothetical protein
MNSMRRTRGAGTRRADWSAKLEVLDPDQMTQQIFELKKTVLA